MNTHRTARRLVTRAATAAALATALGLGAVPAATATGPSAAAPSVRPAGTDPDGSWHRDGLRLKAADNKKVDAFVLRARRAERAISPGVRAAARISHADLIGFDQRLKSPDSLKRKVATSMQESPGRSVDTSLGAINDAVRFTLQWPADRYSQGVHTAAGLLSAWGNDSTRWANTWNRTAGYKAINSAWRAPRSHQLFEVQFHTPESKAAQLETHKLYEEQRLPGTPRERVRELQDQQNAIFAAVPVPPGAERLTAPARGVPAPDPARRLPVPAHAPAA
ncbi:ATP nucleotide 3'-pyrophosphokinase [Streptomyces sp. MCA2]|uniref:ATP nucleotide 3'-pyrophosphokinase n=1 Tax=Streptomyces TaxID=1883 RepID=UPI0020218E7A|nr:ATP nucleotide 3'-pyrophosphokinase [Streptomyces sp. MCA2]MCL7491948.1 ATP nucleotide 3'-pyrophosphokinase [Streptomyces sp. MCA2]